jgi:hypothetical protein
MAARRVYSTLRKRYTTEALRGLGFVIDGGRMVKRGACRREKAVATSRDGVWWRVTPFERGWQH